MARQVTIRCLDQVGVTDIDISRSAPRVAVLRYLSEFRDNIVSRSAFGRKFIRAYTRKQLGTIRTTGVLSAFLVLTARLFARRTGKGAGVP
jgi:hypothetical protein